MKRITLFIAFAMVLSQVIAQVITVKQDGTGDYTVIQQAINAAQDGDTVLVSEGTYYEHINFLGKKIMVASLYLTDPQNPFHVASTVIDGSNPARADSNSVVHFVSGEDTTSVLYGFTIRNGSGTVYKGGGILVYNSGAKILHNRIIDNQVLPSGYGGGIYAGAFEFSPQHLVIIEHNTIEHDSLYGSFQHYGAGIYASMNARIRYNIIQNNDINAPPSGGLGAAIGGGIYSNLYVYDPAGDNHYNLEIAGNTIRNNTVTSINTRGGGVYVYGGKIILKDNNIEGNSLMSTVAGTESAVGGGVDMGWYREGSEISGNTFEDNVAEHASNNSYAGGIHVYTSSDSTWSNIPLKIERNIFRNNAAGYGGALRISRCNMLFQNNYIYGNIAFIRGTAMIIVNELQDPDSVIRLINNTIVNNSYSSFEAIYLYNTNKCLMMNNIIYDTASFTEIRNLMSQEMLELHYNLIDETKINGPYVGSNNMFDDPELLPGSYYFSNNSTPCLDKGGIKMNVFNHEFECATEDIDGIPRPQSGAPEIGAVELLFAGIPESNNNEVLNINISPNPSDGLTRIAFLSESADNSSLTVFDIAGNKVVDKALPCDESAQCEYVIDGSMLTPGVYLVRVITGKATATTKLVVLE